MEKSSLSYFLLNSMTKFTMNFRNLYFHLLFITLTSLSLNCFSQDISDSWTVINCTEISTSCIITIPDSFKKIEVAGNKFYFKENTVWIKNSFEGYIQDSLYNWEPIDELPLFRERSTNIRILYYDQNNLTLKLDYLGGHVATSNTWYEVYLIKDQ